MWCWENDGCCNLHRCHFEWMGGKVFKFRALLDGALRPRLMGVLWMLRALSWGVYGRVWNCEGVRQTWINCHAWHYCLLNGTWDILFFLLGILAARFFRLSSRRVRAHSVPPVPSPDSSMVFKSTLLPHTTICLTHLALWQHTYAYPNFTKTRPEAL